MSEVKFGNTVRVHFAVKLEDGTVFDSTFNTEPLTFTIGMGQVITGFENGVIGMSPSTTKTINIPFDEAYGPYYEDMVTEVNRDEFPADFNFEVGQHMELLEQNGQPALFTVLKVSDSTVTMDKNHPLAGKDLIIDIQLLEIL
jgi:peptidylprolyl isomerase